MLCCAVLCLAACCKFCEVPCQAPAALPCDTLRCAAMRCAVVSGAAAAAALLLLAALAAPLLLPLPCQLPSRQAACCCRCRRRRRCRLAGSFAAGSLPPPGAVRSCLAFFPLQPASQPARGQLAGTPALACPIPVPPPAAHGPATSLAVVPTALPRPRNAYNLFAQDAWPLLREQNAGDSGPADMVILMSGGCGRQVALPGCTCPRAV